MQQSQDSIIGGTLIKEATIKNKVIKLFQLNEDMFSTIVLNADKIVSIRTNMDGRKSADKIFNHELERSRKS